MKEFNKSRLVLVAGLLASGAQLTAAYAQSAPSVVATADSQGEEPAAIGDIVVTAQRRAERLQDVPIAITALSGGQLSGNGAGTIVDLQGSVPGLSITGSAGVNSTNLVSIRGIAGQPVPIGASQATAVYLDGVYLSKPDAGFFGLQDVERVEVLRGPQGTLYGRNATAGAINIITRAPTRDLEGKLDASYGRFNAASVGGYISGPLSGDFAGSLSGSFNERDGYFRNTVTGNRIGDARSYSIRGKVAYLGTGAFDATLSADYSNKSSEDTFVPSTLVNGKNLFSVKNVTTNIENDVQTKLKTGGVSLTMNVEATSSLNVTSISSYRKFDFLTIYDIDATAARAIEPIATNKNETFNQEVRAIYKSGSLNLTMGANYYNEKAQFQIIILPPSYSEALLNLAPNPRVRSDLIAVAAFTQAEYEIVDNLTLVGGLRFNYEKRDFTVDYSLATPNPPRVGRVSDTAVLPSAGVNYKIGRDLLLYAKASKGYQSPGFAYLPGATNPPNVFGAETLWAYEAGIKSQFLDRAVTVNISGFHYDYNAIQLRRTIVLGITTVENAGKATVDGLEGEVILRPVSGLTLNAQATYMKAKYTKFCESITASTPANGRPPCAAGALPGADRRGSRLNEAPDFSGGIGATYETEVASGTTLTVGANYSWESKSYFSSINEAVLSTGGWDRLDARASVKLDNGLTVYGFARNILNERHPTNGFRFGNTVSVNVNDPSTFGFGLSYKF